MKKLVAVLVCVLIAGSLFSLDFFEEFKNPKSYIPDHVVLLTGNDLFNYGISRNDDDQLSYSFDFQVEAPVWYVRLNMNGITNRGWRDGWDMWDHSKPYTPGAPVHRGRYDSIETVLGLKLRPIEEKYYIHLYPEIGFALLGDYGWEWGQNAIHRMMNIHEVTLPYDNPGEKDVAMMLDGRVNTGYKLFNYGRTSLIAEVEASTKNILGFQSENQILGRISISTETHDLLGIHFGYMYATNLNEDPSYTQNLYLRYLNGFRLGFTIDTGIISLKYTATPGSLYGFGYLGIDVMGFFRPRRWQQSDAFLRLSKATFYDRGYNVVSLGLPIYGGLDLMVKNSYLGGDPISPQEEAQADLFKIERFKRDYSFFTIGLRYTFPEIVDNYVTPYLEITGGLQVMKIDVLFNQLDDDALGSFVCPSMVVDLDNYFGVISLEAGITGLPEDLIVFEDTSIQIELFTGLNIVLGGNTDELSFYRIIDKYWEDPEKHPLVDMGPSARFMGYLGIGIKLGFDL